MPFTYLLLNSVGSVHEFHTLAVYRYCTVPDCCHFTDTKPLLGLYVLI